VASTLEFTASGNARQAQLKRNFAKLLRNGAVHEAMRRGSDCVDNADFAAAYRHLISSPHENPPWLRILTEFGVFFGGALFSYALTVAATPGTHLPGALLAIAAMLVGILCAVVKYVPRRSD
jgi:hypothetical protein